MLANFGPNDWKIEVGRQIGGQTQEWLTACVLKRFRESACMTFPPPNLSPPPCMPLKLPFWSFESLAWRKRVVKSCPAPNRWSSIRQCRSPSSCLTREIFFWADTCLEYTQVILRTRSLSLTLLTLSFSRHCGVHLLRTAMSQAFLSHPPGSFDEVYVILIAKSADRHPLKL